MEEASARPDQCDIGVDFMDMTDDRRLMTTAVDVRPGFVPAVGDHAIVGDDGADPRVARIVSIDRDGIIELDVLPGWVDPHLDLLAPT